MIKIIFESHKTSEDNEAGIASGWRDSPLSETGKQQGLIDKERYKDKYIDAVFTSDLIRAIDTAQIIFNKKNIPTFSDARLREYNYGDLEGKNKKEVIVKLVEHIHSPFPNGESVDDVLNRMADFLRYLKENYDNKTIVIIGHRATQLGLEYFINQIDPKVYIETQWVWQPGWEYIF